MIKISWAVAYTISVLGNAAIFLYVASMLEVEDNVGNQLLRFLLVAFAFVFGFSAIAANFPMLVELITLTDAHTMSNAIRAVYIPYIALLIILMCYSIYFLVKKMIEWFLYRKGLESGDLDHEDQRRQG